MPTFGTSGLPPTAGCSSSEMTCSAAATVAAEGIAVRAACSSIQRDGRSEARAARTSHASEATARYKIRIRILITRAYSRNFTY